MERPALAAGLLTIRRSLVTTAPDVHHRGVCGCSDPGMPHKVAACQMLLGQNRWPSRSTSPSGQDWCPVFFTIKEPVSCAVANPSVV
jgi:hypothetical protein